MNRARKLISLIVALLMIIGLSACGGNEGGNTGKTESNNPVSNVYIRKKIELLYREQQIPICRGSAAAGLRRDHGTAGIP